MAKGQPGNRSRLAPPPPPPSLLCLLLLAAAATADQATLQLQQYDSLAVARCAASCWAERAGDSRKACESACLKAPFSKAGACPDLSTLSAFDTACISACAGDADCSATDKCCAHACGVTCQRAEGLAAAAGLPPVPENVTATEGRRTSRVQLEWAVPGASTATAAADAVADASEGAEAPPVLYVLEERHHVGRHLAPDRLGAWVPRHRSARPSVTLRGVLRAGRWYQFRVAAVNANGSRGFSEPSRPFRLAAAPQAPGQPQNLSVGPLGGGVGGGGLRALLRWGPPASDLPVQRYKVFWSRRLQGASHVLVHHQAVPGDVTRFMLKDLEPDSLYFLQVQAISQFGRDRLKGDKAAYFLNTGKPSPGKAS